MDKLKAILTKVDPSSKAAMFSGSLIKLWGVEINKGKEINFTHPWHEKSTQVYGTRTGGLCSVDSSHIPIYI